MDIRRNVNCPRGASPLPWGEVRGMCGWLDQRALLVYKTTTAGAGQDVQRRL